MFPRNETWPRRAIYIEMKIFGICNYNYVIVIMIIVIIILV